MSYKITVLKLDITKQPKGYYVAEVAYKTDDGKTKGMKVLDFVQKDIFAVLKDGVKPGDVLDADFEKNAKGFWQFAQLVKSGVSVDFSKPATQSTSTSTGASKGNWETSEERAARQVMIVRQSSLAQAVNFSELIGNKKADLEDIIAIARVFESYVLATKDNRPEVAQTGEVE